MRLFSLLPLVAGSLGLVLVVNVPKPVAEHAAGAIADAILGAQVFTRKSAHGQLSVPETPFLDLHELEEHGGAGAVSTLAANALGIDGGTGKTEGASSGAGAGGAGAATEFHGQAALGFALGAPGGEGPEGPRVNDAAGGSARGSTQENLAQGAAAAACAGSGCTAAITEAAAVPEPSTWGLMLLGFTALGLAKARQAARA